MFQGYRIGLSLETFKEENMELKKGEVYMVIIDGMAHAFGSSLLLAKVSDETEDYVELEAPVVLIQSVDRSGGIGVSLLPLPTNKDRRKLIVNRKYLVAVFEPDSLVLNEYLKAVSGLLVATSLDLKDKTNDGGLISA
jgi:hypothetical protein